jgi:hypothetical protein
MRRTIRPSNRQSHSTRLRLPLAGVLAAALAAAPALADETDQFTLPPRETFVDLGDYFSALHCQVLQHVVDDTNRTVARFQKIDDPVERRARIEALFNGSRLAREVRAPFGLGFFEMKNIEDALRGASARRLFPDATTAYRTPQWIYFYTHLPVDPRRVILLFQSSTIKVYGAYHGTDKWGHFHDLGNIYYQHYLGGLRAGRTHDDAVRNTVVTFSEGFISESQLIGAIATGVRSNADLATNYLGMKFYMNLTEPVTLQGETHPPLIVRIGDYLALNRHVRPESDFMAPFLSDHWNEALNPSAYEWGMRDPIAKRLRENAESILAFYADEHGVPRTREWFLAKYEELSTYFGEDYGHVSMSDAMVTIADHCFEPPGGEGEGEQDEAHAKARTPPAKPG